MSPGELSPSFVPLAAAGLAAVHLFAGVVGDLEMIPRSEWLSLAGGVSVAYVFVHVLPAIQVASRTVETSTVLLSSLEHHVYLVSLLGFGSFYGLERFVQTAGASDGPGRSPDGAEPGVFWLHLGSFAVYNALVGYLLVHREVPGVVSLLLYAVAMALHFVVNDAGLREHHGRMYHAYGRWLLAAAVLGGLVVGLATEVSEPVVSVLFAFLAGGVILNVIKEELPNERRSRFRAFALGAGGYTAVLLAV